MKTVYSALSVLLAVALLGCAQPSGQSTQSAQPAPAGDLGAEEAAIRATDNQWLAIASKKLDPDKTASFWSDDATIYAPNQPPIIGRQAIRSYIAGASASPDFSITWVTDKIVVSRSGDMAYSTGSNQFTYRTPDNKVVTEKNHGIVVWKKQPDGAWKALIDIWNAAAPATPLGAVKKK